MPNTYTIILIFIVIIIVEGIIFSLANNLKKKQNDQTETTELDKLPQTLPYEKDMLLTKMEYAFYNILKSKCDEANMLICPKVRLEDFVKVTDKENINKWRGHIRSRHVDFLICDSKLKIVAAIELDDNSHNSKQAQKVDEFKNNLFNSIGIPLYRIKTNSSYSDEIDNVIKTIKSIILNLI